MDVSMPGLDGLEATFELKARLPDVTVLMLSVGDKEQEIAAGLAGGASEYLVKGGPARRDRGRDQALRTGSGNGLRRRAPGAGRLPVFWSMARAIGWRRPGAQVRRDLRRYERA